MHNTKQHLVRVQYLVFSAGISSIGCTSRQTTLLDHLFLALPVRVTGRGYRVQNSLEHIIVDFIHLARPRAGSFGLPLKVDDF